MLEHDAVAAHLGRPADLPVADPQVGTLLGREAHRTGRTVVAGDRGVDPEAREPVDQRPRASRR